MSGFHLFCPFPDCLQSFPKPLGHQIRGYVMTTSVDCQLVFIFRFVSCGRGQWCWVLEGDPFVLDMGPLMEEQLYIVVDITINAASVNGAACICLHLWSVYTHSVQKVRLNPSAMGLRNFVIRLPVLKGGHSNTLQHSCLENPVDRGVWLATVHRVAQNQTRLKQLGRHTRTYFENLMTSTSLSSEKYAGIFHMILESPQPFLNLYSSD